MAGEVGHVVYAARLLTFLGDKVQDPSYWIGTLFPDIRHLGVITRQRTHLTDVTLQSLVGKNDFHTGMRVHAWVDATREQYLRDQNVKETLPWHPFVPHALKLVEDEILYDTFDDWNLIHRVLNTVHDEELHYVHSKEHIQQWHTTLQAYLREKPTDKTRKELALGIGLSENSADELNNVTQTLKSDKKTITLLHNFLEHLERLLQ
jgi:hypothetical protein